MLSFLPLLLLLLLTITRVSGLQITEQACEEPKPEIYAIYGAFSDLGQNLLETLQHALPLPNKVRVIYKPAQDFSAPNTESNVEYVSSENLTLAFVNVNGAFIVPHLPYTTAGGRDKFREAYEQGVDALVTALRDARVSKIVLLSAMGAHIDPQQQPVGSTAHSHLAEEKFKQLASKLVIVRPGWNLENFRTMARAVSQKQRVLPSFLPPELGVEMIGNGDLAYVMAQFMLNERRNEPVLVREVAMERAFTSNEIADAVTAVLHKRETKQPGARVKPVGVPKETYAKLFRYMDEDALADFEQSLDALAAGVIRFQYPKKVLRVKTKLEELVEAWFEN